MDLSYTSILESFCQLKDFCHKLEVEEDAAGVVAEEIEAVEVEDLVIVDVEDLAEEVAEGSEEAEEGLVAATEEAFVVDGVEILEVVEASKERSKQRTPVMVMEEEAIRKSSLKSNHLTPKICMLFSSLFVDFLCFSLQLI